MKGFRCIVPAAILFILAGWCRMAYGGTFTTLWTFTDGVDGATPYAGLVQGTDSNLYSMALEGGNGFGTIFKITPSGVFTQLYDFSGSGDGALPYGALIQGFDGKFYGTTSYGGSSADNGSIFKITSAGTFTPMYHFNGGADGSGPEAALVQGADTNFYGTAYGGGNGYGTVFRITPANVLTPLHDFTGSPDGANPSAPLVRSGTNFYGTTTGGGSNDYGTVFRITSAGSLTILYHFTGGADGGVPYAGLVMGSDSNLYGTTYAGGTNLCGCGTIFRITTNGTLTTLYDFSNGADGAFPEAELVQASDGNFYGTASQGGTSSNGTLFSVTPAGVLTPLYSFTNGLDGAFPYAPLIQGLDGNFYGTASAAGSNDYGTVFKFALSGGCNSNFMPQVSAIQIVGTNVVITLPTVPCQTYQLQYSDAMVPTNWTNIGSAVPGTGSPIQFTEPVGSLCSPLEACVPSPSNLVSWWPGDGNAIDLVGGNNGVLSNGATFAAGEVCQAFSFTNSGASVVVGNPTNLQLNVFTIELWFRRHSTTQISNDPNHPNGFGALFGYSGLVNAAPGGGYGFWITSTGQLYLTETGYNNLFASTTVTDTNWHHGAVTWSGPGNTAIFYLDGVAYPSGPCSTPNSPCFDFQFPTPAAIGCLATEINNQTGAFNGDIDEVSVYNTVLSAAEIQAIYNAGAAGKCKPASAPHRFYRVGISP